VSLEIAQTDCNKLIDKCSNVVQRKLDNSRMVVGMVVPATVLVVESVLPYIGEQQLKI